MEWLIALESETISFALTDLAGAISYASPLSVATDTAGLLCKLIADLARVTGAEPSGATLALEAGAISLVFEYLRRWMDVEDVVCAACTAIADLVSFGSDGVREAVRAVPDFEVLLRAAVATGFDISEEDEGDGDDANLAQFALRKLGFEA